MVWYLASSAVLSPITFLSLTYRLTFLKHPQLVPPQGFYLSSSLSWNALAPELHVVDFFLLFKPYLKCQLSWMSHLNYVRPSPHIPVTLRSITYFILFLAKVTISIKFLFIYLFISIHHLCENVSSLKAGTPSVSGLFVDVSPVPVALSGMCSRCSLNVYGWISE